MERKKNQFLTVRCKQCFKTVMQKQYATNPFVLGLSKLIPRLSIKTGMHITFPVVMPVCITCRFHKNEQYDCTDQQKQNSTHIPQHFA